MIGILYGLFFLPAGRDAVWGKIDDNSRAIRRNFNETRLPCLRQVNRSGR